MWEVKLNTHNTNRKIKITYELEGNLTKFDFFIINLADFSIKNKKNMPDLVNEFSGKYGDIFKLIQNRFYELFSVEISDYKKVKSKISLYKKEKIKIFEKVIDISCIFYENIDMYIFEESLFPKEEHKKKTLEKYKHDLSKKHKNFKKIKNIEYTSEKGPFKEALITLETNFSNKFIINGFNSMETEKIYLQNRIKATANDSLEKLSDLKVIPVEMEHLNKKYKFLRKEMITKDYQKYNDHSIVGFEKNILSTVDFYSFYDLVFYDHISKNILDLKPNQINEHKSIIERYFSGNQNYLFEFLEGCDDIKSISVLEGEILKSWKSVEKILLNEKINSKYKTYAKFTFANKELLVNKLYDFLINKNPILLYKIIINSKYIKEIEEDDITLYKLMMLVSKILKQDRLEDAKSLSKKHINKFNEFEKLHKTSEMEVNKLTSLGNRRDLLNSLWSRKELRPAFLEEYSKDFMDEFNKELSVEFSFTSHVLNSLLHKDTVKWTGEKLSEHDISCLYDSKKFILSDNKIEHLDKKVIDWINSRIKIINWISDKLPYSITVEKSKTSQ